MMPAVGKSTLMEALRFCMVGVAATAIHYGIYWLLKRWINVNIAFATGYIISFFCNYFLSALFTFKAKVSFRTGIGFTGAHLFNMILQLILLNVFLHFGINSNLAPLPVYAISVPVNFFLVRFVFRKL